MKLLFDQNLSPRLVIRLADLYPSSLHVSTVGLDQVFDKDVWLYAKSHNYIIVTKDIDFSELNALWGFPPKIIWIRRGNCTTKDIELILRRNYNAISDFVTDRDIGSLILL